MLLRKHLTNAELKEVSLVGFERILAFRFFCVSDFSSTEKILYAEIMGKYSNLILTENGVITGALKTTAIGENCKRLIFPGAKYEFPEPQDKVDPTDYPALFSLLKDARQENLDEFLFKHVRGIAPVTAENIVKWYGGEGVFAKHVYDYLFSNEITACVNDRDFFVRWEDGATLFPTLSAAQAYFYGRKSREKEIAAMKRKLSSAVNSAIKKQEKRLAQIAKTLGIEELLEKYPYEVSGGQKQRAAVARALITKPQLILADEPTGALDSKASDELLRLFARIHEDGQTILMVTHSVKAASSADRILFIKDGEVFHQLYRGNLTNEQMYQKISDTLTVLTTGGVKHE